MKNQKVKTAVIAAAVLTVMAAVLLLLLPVEKKNQMYEKYGKLAVQAETDEKSKYILDHVDEYPKEILDYYYNGDQFLDFVYNYPEHKDDYSTMSYTEEELNSEKPPRLYMDDTRWCYQPMGGGRIVSNGCAAVSLTMAYIHLTGKGDIDPYKIAFLAENMDAIGFFGGINVLKLKDVAEVIGLTADEQRFCDDSNKKTDDPDIDSMKAIIDSGHVLLAGCKGEAFGDHAILITGYDGEEFTINDPANREKSEKLWTYEELAPEIYFMWELSAGKK